LFLAFIYRSTAARYRVEALYDVTLFAVIGIAAAAGFLVANSLGQTWISLVSSASVSLLAFCILTLAFRRRQVSSDITTVFFAHSSPVLTKNITGRQYFLFDKTRQLQIPSCRRPSYHQPT
jgi:hypothetical protein